MTKKIPQIRFKGFDEEWEEVKIKDIADVKAGGDINKSKLRDTGRYPVIGNGITKDSSIIGYYEDEYKVKAPAVTLTGRGDIGVPIARNVSFTPVVRLLSLKFQDQYNVYFMANSLSNVNFLKETTGVPQLTSISVKNYKIKITSPPEQEKIGALFEKVDSLIEGQAGLVDSYKGLKKSLLQKMFPKEGEKIPQIRFPGFDGEWEEIKFKDILHTISSKKYILASDIQKNGKNIVIQQGDNPELGFTDYDGFNDYDKVVLFGDHTLSLYKPKQPFLLSTDGIKIIYNNNINSNFLYYLLERYKPDSEGYKRHFIILKNSICYLIKDIYEQKKIGDLFKKLDGLIEGEEKYLEDLKVLKKSLLQKMFV